MQILLPFMMAVLVTMGSADKNHSTAEVEDTELAKAESSRITVNQFPKETKAWSYTYSVTGKKRFQTKNESDDSEQLPSESHNPHSTSYIGNPSESHNPHSTMNMGSPSGESGSETRDSQGTGSTFQITVASPNEETAETAHGYGNYGGHGCTTTYGIGYGGGIKENIGATIGLKIGESLGATTRGIVNGIEGLKKLAAAGIQIKTGIAKAFATLPIKVLKVANTAVPAKAKVVATVGQAVSGVAKGIAAGKGGYGGVGKGGYDGGYGVSKVIYADEYGGGHTGDFGGYHGALDSSPGYKTSYVPQGNRGKDQGYSGGYVSHGDQGKNQGYQGNDQGYQGGYETDHSGYQ